MDQMETRLMGNGISITIGWNDETELQVSVSFEGKLISETQVTLGGATSVRVGDGTAVWSEDLKAQIRSLAAN